MCSNAKLKFVNVLGGFVLMCPCLLKRMCGPLHPFAASIEIAKGANSGKFVNVLDHRPKVSLVLYKR